MSKHSIRTGSASSSKRLAQVVERVDALLAAPLGPQLVLLEREPRVALGQLVDPPLLAALRVRAARPGRSRRSSSASFTTSAARERRRADDLGRDRERRRVVLDRELLGHLALAAAGAVLEIEALAVGEHAVAHLEDLRVRVRVVDRDRDHVERADRLVRDPLALEQRPDRPQPVAERRPPARTPAPPRPPAMPLLELALDLRGSGRRGSRRSRRCSRGSPPREM